MLGRITVALFALLLVWGNLVAGLKAGLACPDWPLCQGRVLPPLRLDIYMEFGHRVIAAAASVFLAVLCVRRFKAYRGAARAVPVTALLIVAAAIVMGGFVVLLGLPAQLTTIHFMAAFIVFLLAYYMMSFDGIKDPPGFSLKGAAALVMALGALVFFQAALGAYVRHSHAGLACPDFPKCLGEWIPPLVSGGVLAHYSHRVTAAFITMSALGLYTASVADPRLRRIHKGALAMLGLAVFQLAVGMAVVLSGLYFAATALHICVAIAMLYVLAGMWAGEVKAGQVVR